MTFQQLRNNARRLVLVPLLALAAAGVIFREEAAQVFAEPAPDSNRGAARARVVVLGDSLGTSAGKDSYPGVLQRRIEEAGYRYEVVNASRGGDTTGGGLRRLDEALEGNVEILILELGGNDGLRGHPLESIRGNLVAIIERAKARGIKVLLVQMETTPTHGTDYMIAFHKMYGEIAAEQGVELVPFILAGVYGQREYTTDDIHPNAAGAAKIAETVWGSLEPVLKKR